MKRFQDFVAYLYEIRYDRFYVLTRMHFLFAHYQEMEFGIDVGNDDRVELEELINDYLDVGIL